MSLLEPGEAANAHKANILKYQAGADFLALQAAAPEKLAALTAGMSAEALARRPGPDKWSIQELAAHLADDELVGADTNASLEMFQADSCGVESVRDSRGTRC